MASVTSLGLPQLKKIALLKLWAPSIVTPSNGHRLLTPLSQLGLTWKAHPHCRASCVVKQAFPGTVSQHSLPLPALAYTAFLPQVLILRAFPHESYCVSILSQSQLLICNTVAFMRNPKLPKYLVMNKYLNTTSLGHQHIFFLLLFLLFSYSATNC